MVVITFMVFITFMGVTRVFPKSTNQPKEMALTICSSVSRYSFPWMGDWNWERKIPNVLFRTEKRGTSGGSPQFPNGLFGKLLFHLTFNRNFGFFG